MKEVWRLTVSLSLQRLNPKRRTMPRPYVLHVNFATQLGG